MNVQVLLFAGIRQRAGTPSLLVDVADDATVAELKATLSAAHPELAVQIGACRVAVEHEFRSDDERIAAGAEIALIPPVSGGHDDTRISTHCCLTSRPLDPEAVLAAVEHEEAGGITSFVGNVRRQSRGKIVSHLEYEAYGPMALAEMERIATEIEQRYAASRVCIHHRIGRLEIGEAAVIISASAPHRAEAFSACRDAIEALKQRVPIWKREVDEHGAEWIGQGP